MIIEKPNPKNLMLQILMVILFVSSISFLFYNTYQNMQRQDIASGFGFLWSTSGFSIIQSPIEYSESSSYWRAFQVGLLNTIIVSLAGVFAATVIGFLIGIARLSKNFLLRKIADGYVETIRNIPLLIQIYFCYIVVLGSLPTPKGAYSFFGSVFLTNRGFYIPMVDSTNALISTKGLIVFVIGIAILGHFVSKKKSLIPHKSKLAIGTLAIALTSVITWFATSTLVYPELRGFNFRGGLQLIPELTALFIALSIYTASFIAEIVRAGIQSVAKGQKEAGSALGLSDWQVTSKIVVPQAMRVIIPPLASQYLNLFKNSSLAAIIGYPDLVQVFAGTVLNQTGQAVEIIFITMCVYLTVSLSISGFMNWFNIKMAIVER